MKDDDKKSEILPNFSSFRDFDEAAKATLKYLQERHNFGLWMITRTVKNDWIVLKSADKKYYVKPGDVFQWTDSFCYQMVQEKGPNIAPDSDTVSVYLNAPIGKYIDIKSYIGYPLMREDGSLFGTLCAIDPNPMPDKIKNDDSLFRILAQFISYSINNELKSIELKDKIAELTSEAYHDGLTNALNRKGWDILIEQQMEKHKHIGEPITVIMMDLDNLKKINDSLGHEKGDEYIINAYKALLEASRKNDAIARLGGDEFGILLEGEIAINPEPLIERIRTYLVEFNVEASLGWATLGKDDDIISTMKNADDNMYQDKTMRKAHKSE
jgi:diguanylate cyclase (GGDEF)-like protein